MNVLIIIAVVVVAYVYLQWSGDDPGDDSGGSGSDSSTSGLSADSITSALGSVIVKFENTAKNFASSNNPGALMTGGQMIQYPDLASGTAAMNALIQKIWSITQNVPDFIATWVWGKTFGQLTSDQQAAISNYVSAAQSAVGNAATGDPTGSGDGGDDSTNEDEGSDD